MNLPSSEGFQPIILRPGISIWLFPRPAKLSLVKQTPGAIHTQMHIMLARILGRYRYSNYESQQEGCHRVY